MTAASIYLIFLDGVAAINFRDDDISRRRLQTGLHYRYVTAQNSSVDHRLATHLHKNRLGRPRNEQLIERLSLQETSGMVVFTETCTHLVIADIERKKPFSGHQPPSGYLCQMSRSDQPLRQPEGGIFCFKPQSPSQ